MRTTAAAICGGCGKSVAEAQVVLVIEIPGLKRKLIRGECCAGSAPPNLPREERRSDFTKPMRKVSTIKLPIDVRARQFKESA